LEHFSDHLPREIFERTSNLHCEPPMYTQRLYSGEQAEERQPLGAVDVVLPTRMVFAGSDVEKIHVGAHGENLSEDEGDVRNMGICIRAFKCGGKIKIRPKGDIQSTPMRIDSEIDFNAVTNKVHLRSPKPEVLCAADEQEKLGDQKKVMPMHVR